MNDLLQDYRAHVEAIGRDRAGRRFVLSTLLTTRYHLSSRPISAANRVFFERLAVSCDALLELLLHDEWVPAEGLEPGLEEVVPFSRLVSHSLSAEQLGQEFRRIYRRHFQTLNVPWSRLVPTASLGLDAWASPQRALVCVGPNIGIGDELLYFELAQRLRRRYPGIALELVSYNHGLWEQCPEPVEACYLRTDQLAPFARAARVLAEDPEALVIFVEFASSPIYRELESVRSLPRFVYLDSGARVARVVDQRTRAIAEHTIREAPDMYELLHRLLLAIGLDGDHPRLMPPARPAAGRPRVFVNPFSSKDFRILSPAWWAAALDFAAQRCELSVVLFCGVNETSRAWAREIVEHARLPPDRFELHGAHEVPTVAETLAEASRSQAVFGLDTYTGHVGVIRRVPCLTLFFGSQWDMWRVPNNHTLNVYVQCTAENAGHLLARLLTAPATAPEPVRAVLAATRGIERELAAWGHAAQALAAAQALVDAVLRWAELDPTLAEAFVDVPVEYGAALLEALQRAAADERPMSDELRALVRDGLRSWQSSNLYRYAVLVAERGSHEDGR